MTPKMKTSLIAASLTLGVTASAAYVALDQNGTGFHPLSSLRDLQNNQVLFPDSSAAGAQNGDSSQPKDNDSYWERDDQQEETTNPNGGANYLFENDQTIPGEAAAGLPGDLSPDQLPANAPTAEVIYDFVDGDGTGADTVLPSGGTGGLLPGGDGESGGTGTEPGGTSTPSTPGTPSNPSGGEISGGGSITPGGDTGGGGGGGAAAPDPAPAPTPTPTPADITETIKDPEPSGGGSTNPGTSFGGQSRPFSSMTDSVKDSGKLVMKLLPQEAATTPLYRGKTAAITDLLSSITAYVADTSNPSQTNIYYWTADDLGTFLRLAGFSTDGGTTIQDSSDLPLTIPTDGSVEEVWLYWEYRLRETDAWQPLYYSGYDENWNEITLPYVPCPVASNRIYVLTQKLDQNAERIDPDDVIDSTCYVDNNGLQLNLLSMQKSLLSSWIDPDTGNLTRLFPGWTENGKLVDWFYTPATFGRHILQPADLVEIDPAYTVQLDQVWMSKDYQIDSMYSNLCYLQTLTGWSGGRALEDEPAVAAEHDGAGTLSVPEGIQYVSISDDDPFSVDRLELPASLISLEDNDNLRVNQSYVVAEDNAFLNAEDGMLFNKNMDTLLAVPYEKEEISIPAEVEKVILSQDNQLRVIHLEARSSDEFPDIDLSCLSGATLTFEDEELMAQFAAQHRKELGSNRLAVEEAGEYVVENGLVLTTDGQTLHRVLPGKTAVVLPDSITSIDAGAFSGSDAALVLLPKNETVTFQPGSLQDCAIQAVLCRSADQLSAVQSQLAQAGAADSLIVAVIGEQNGYCYYTYSSGETTLLTAPADAVRFDSATLPGLNITSIANEAFSNCTQLQWAFLPESVSYVGTSAFADCTALEGVLIDNRESVTIGNDAFSGCSALRFVASNAPKAEMKDGYDPDLVQAGDQDRNMTRYASFFYIPAYGDGYGSHITLGDDDEIYTILEENGNVLLCAEAPADIWGNPAHTRIMRSGAALNGSLVLPEDTTAIDKFAFAFTSGEYTVNWEALPALTTVSGGACYRSGLTGDIHLVGYNELLYFPGVYVLDYAFGSCPDITSVTVDHTAYLWPDSFSGSGQLAAAAFYDVSSTFELNCGLFNGCDALTDVTLDCVTPPGITIRSPGSPFQLNYMWDIDEEAARLNFHLNEQADPLDFVKEWRYIAAGYYNTEFGSTDYLALWNAMNSTWIEDDFDPDDPFGGWRFPTDQETDMMAKLAVLGSENRLRTLLGMETVDEPTDFYGYRIQYQGDTGYLTLTNSSTLAEEITLDAATLEMPEGWCLDHLGLDSFASAPNLSKVTVNDPLVSIQEGAFCNLNRDFTLVLNDKETVTELALNKEGSPFEFGLDAKHLHVVVPEALKADYFNAWLYPLAGYSDGIGFYNAIWAELGESASADDVLARANEILAPLKEQLSQILDYTPPADETPETLVLPETPAAEEVPVVEEPPAEEPAPGEEETPAEEEPSSEPETPAEPESPAESETPDAGQTPGEDEVSDKEEAPAQDEAPSDEAETAGGTDTPEQSEPPEAETGEDAAT